ncbi:TPA: tRNA 2-thiouridine(34) synthase MnmA [Candidatus Dependentiae bacterium]|nr:tRNA 2-thiouridine(34) synthase MnmA [Candidatus Dependentiae bacterium]HBZ73403.1 tRNA 2-thiouridine(34) synthase MnmA [Candidatus Dependentiae bacterium]
MKIAVLVSGGVDSSVVLKLLKDQGHDLTAFYLKIWLEDELSYLGSCPWEEDLQYVTDLCQMLNVPLQVVSMQKEYHEKVVAYTIAEVAAGRTPNPDVLCNQHIKFGIFYDKIGKDFDKVATGHYAQIEEIDGKYFLKRSPDQIKDQTYFLCNLSQTQLSKAIFPIGHLEKSEVRSLAERFNLPTKARKDSQGICFLGKFDFRDFLAHHLGEKEGNILEFGTNKLLGHHKGHWFYTIGQRQGICLSAGPWYVVAKEPAQNIIYVSNHYEQIDDLRLSFEVEKFNWFEGKNPSKKDLLVKVRHRSIPKQCSLNFINANLAEVILSQKDQGIASGQFATFYDGEICLGGGVIK